MGVNLIDLMMVSGGTSSMAVNFGDQLEALMALARSTGWEVIMLLKAATACCKFSWAASFAGIIFEAEFQFIIIVGFAEID